MPELRTITEGDDGIRLDRWFRRHYPALTHARLEKLLRKGEVRVDGKRAKSADRVMTGQVMRLPPQIVHDKVEERPKAAPVQTTRKLEDAILYMDKHLFVLNKPSGLATQGGSGLKEHVDGMLDQLSFEKATRPKLVHRLDRDTSGVLLVARTAQAAAGLSRELASRDASKVYWALVKGVPKQKHGIVKAALAKEGMRGKDERMAVSEDEDAKFALTEYAVMGQAGQEFAWVAARPVTGRTHQIRVHLASLGTPIVGDFKYGGVEAKGKGAIVDKLHLHARSIDIARPDGGRLQVVAPLSPHMLKSWELLGFDANDKRDPFPSKEAETMKRFYKDVTVEETAGGFRFLLDGRPVQTPARRPLLLPTLALTEAIAEEWRGQDFDMQPAAMPLTRLVNTVLDGMQANRAELIAAILRFGENDLLSYRVETPVELAARQLDWNTLLDWAAERHEARMAVTSGIQHVEQSAETLAALRQAVEARNDFEIVALHVLASITGSLVLGLAALDGHVSTAEAFALSRLDESYQAEKWGRDHEAEERAARLATEMEQAARLVRLSRA